MMDWWKGSGRGFVMLTAGAGFDLANSRMNAAEPQKEAPAGPRPLNADEA